MLRPTEEAWQLPERLQTIVTNELDEGEQLLWLDQPKPTRDPLQTRRVVPFGIAWTAFAVLWTALAYAAARGEGEGAWVFPLVGVPFILLGLLMLCSPLWARRSGNKTAYAITDRRAISFGFGWGTSIRSFRLGRLGEVHRTERPDGSGDLIFNDVVTYDSDDDSRVRKKFGFFGIANVKEVESIIEALVARDGH